MKNLSLAAWAYALLGALIGALICGLEWMLGGADAFASFPLYGSIGATVLGLMGLSADENARAATGTKNKARETSSGAAPGATATRRHHRGSASLAPFLRLVRRNLAGGHGRPQPQMLALRALAESAHERAERKHLL